MSLRSSDGPEIAAGDHVGDCIGVGPKVGTVGTTDSDAMRSRSACEGCHVTHTVLSSPLLNAHV